MPIVKKPIATSKTFSPKLITKAKASADAEPVRNSKLDWSKATVTSGGGVEKTLAALKKVRGPNKRPAKEQVAIRLDPEVLSAFRAGGPGWQTRMNAVLKDWLAAH